MKKIQVFPRLAQLTNETLPTIYPTMRFKKALYGNMLVAHRIVNRQYWGPV